MGNTLGTCWNKGKMKKIYLPFGRGKRFLCSTCVCSRCLCDGFAADCWLPLLREPPFVGLVTVALVLVVVVEIMLLLLLLMEGLKSYGWSWMCSFLRVDEEELRLLHQFTFLCRLFFFRSLLCLSCPFSCAASFFSPSVPAALVFSSLLFLASLFYAAENGCCQLLRPSVIISHSLLPVFFTLPRTVVASCWGRASSSLIRCFLLFLRCRERLLPAAEAERHHLSFAASCFHRRDHPRPVFAAASYWVDPVSLQPTLPPPSFNFCTSSCWRFV